VYKRQVLNSAGSSNGPNFDITWANVTTPIPDLPKTTTLRVDTEGEYEMTITNTTNGCATSDQTTVAANFAKPQLEVKNDFISCQKRTTDLFASSVTPLVTFEWESPNLPDKISNAQISVSDTGFYQITVRDSRNGCTTVDTAFVRDERIFPIVEAGEPLTLNCDQPVVNLDGDGTDTGDNFRYTWTTNDGRFVSGTDINALTPRVDSSGTYYLNVRNTENGCSSRDSVFVDSSFTAPSIRIIADSILTCFAPNLFIDASQSDSGALFSFDWFAEAGNVL